MFKRSLAVMMAACALYACSSDDNNTSGGGTNTGDGGTNNNSNNNTGGNTVKLTGQVIDYAEQVGSAGWDVEAGGAKVQTNAKGSYELAVPKDTAIQLTLSDPGGKHYKLVDQEMKLSGDYDRGRLRFVGTAVGDLLLGSLKADKAKPIVSVGLVALDSCKAKAADFPQGAKMSAAGAKVVYYKGNPDPSLTEAQAGADPAGVVFDTAPGAAIDVQVDYSKCTKKAFPVTVGNVTYTGKLEPSGNSTLTVFNIYFE